MSPDEYEALFGEAPPTTDSHGHDHGTARVATLTPPPVPNVLPVPAERPTEPDPPIVEPAAHWKWALGGAAVGAVIALVLTVFVIKPSRDTAEPDTLVEANTLTSAETSRTMSGQPLTPDDVTLARTDLSAVTILPQLVAETPYSRGLYRLGGWPDSDNDCQDNRTEVLIAEATGPLEYRSDGCVVLTGEWTDPYAGIVLTHSNTTAINHLVPLAEAHRAGAWAWTDAERAAFAADLGSDTTLVVVSTPMDQGKGDRRPEQWRPPMRSAWCGYAVDWISVKTRWDLAFLQAEVDALNDMLDTCIT